MGLIDFSTAFFYAILFLPFAVLLNSASFGLILFTAHDIFATLIDVK